MFLIGISLIKKCLLRNLDILLDFQTSIYSIDYVEAHSCSCPLLSLPYFCFCPHLLSLSRPDQTLFILLLLQLKCILLTGGRITSLELFVNFLNNALKTT